MSVNTIWGMEGGGLWERGDDFLQWTREKERDGSEAKDDKRKIDHFQTEN
jgi:hypothetical protein